MTTYIFLARGIGETYQNNTVSAIGNVLKSLHDVVVEEINWLAQYGPFPKANGSSYMNSLNTLYQQVQFRLNRLGENDDFALIGYSGGADGMGNIAKHLPAWLMHKCRGVFLIADPSMPKIGNNVKYGIRGERKIDSGITVMWYYDKNDPIPLCTPSPNPIRTLADRTPWLSFALPWLIPATGAADLSAKLSRRPIQRYVINPFDINATKRRYEIAFDELMRYLVKGDHSSYISRGYTRDATMEIARVLRY